MNAAPPKIQFDPEGATVDARLVGEGLGLDAERVPELMRTGAITCAFERGINEDAGRVRLTFWHGRHRFRVIVDDDGAIVQRLRIDYGQEQPG